jgi:hypothetical protein
MHDLREIHHASEGNSVSFHNRSGAKAISRLPLLSSHSLIENMKLSPRNASSSPFQTSLSLLIYYLLLSVESSKRLCSV